MIDKLIEHINTTLREIREDGLYKEEREITSPQSSEITVDVAGDSQSFLNFCANNYLGLADDSRLIEAAKHGLDEYGFGMASVRFICGTQDIHRQLERELAGFLGMEDAILFSSCFDANAGIFEVLLGPDDAIISDSLNHASIIDGVRLCKATRYRYANNNLDELAQCLEQAQQQRFRLVVTDGVFSMDGVIADLPGICDLAEANDTVVMVDDSHAVGFMGARGAGTAEFHGVEGRVDILSGTFGKALGGASGGYIAGPESVVQLLRQRARPYLFSNALAPSIVCATRTALQLLEDGEDLRRSLQQNAARFRAGMTRAGFTLAGKDHPIVPVMLGDAKVAAQMAASLNDRGIFVSAFSFPVVPKGQARIRTQMSAAHTSALIDFAIQCFQEVGMEMGIPGVKI